ncbi:MAG TPA: SBBP repeat-containing protein, partial [Pyrinomonadaceae bacterium]
MPRSPYLSSTSRRASACASVIITCAVAVAGYFAASHGSPKRAADGVESRAAAPTFEEAARARQAFGELPLQFEANRGQTDSSVKFLARGDGYNLFLTPNEAVLDLRRRDAAGAGERAVLRVKLVGANPAPAVEGRQPLEAKSNYPVGGNSSASPVSAETFARVGYAGVYEGVDAVYYGNQGRLEYDFVVRPHADPSQIAIAFEGAEGVELDAAGELVLHTALGEVRQHRPVVYQETAEGRREVAGRYIVRESASAASPAHPSYTVGFELGDYDHSAPLVIDPVLVYSTYLGGGGSNDTAHGVAVDSAGNAYITGETISTDFPTTAGAVQTTFGGFNYDAYVTKLNPTGTAIVYSTYLGGRDRDQGYDVAVDAGGNAYVVGGTLSDNFPVTPGAFQPVYGGGTYANGLGGDAFVAKLNATGTALLYSTYLGGGAAEEAWGVAIDAAGNAYVAGGTWSDNFPVLNALQPARRGDRDGFVTKLDASGAALVYSTYFGGTTKFDSLNASGL